ncbi:MAG: hypothetical protein ACFHXK_16350 [bacterium]
MKLRRLPWHTALRQSSSALALTVGLTSFAYADSGYTVTDYAASWGPGIGASAPMLSALDQNGNQQNLESLSRANGLLFVFNRSVDW